jgi:hypothetical protein
MRTGQPIISRPAWHDRNPSQQLLWYTVNGAAPHSAIDRWTYTVPTGKKAMLEALDGLICILTAATTAGRRKIYVRLTKSGGGSADIMNLQISTNGVGDVQTKTLGTSLLMLQGDTITGFTADESVGGTVDYRLMAKLTEFDA